MGNMRCSHHQGTRDSLRAVTALAARYDIETRVVQEGFPSPLTDCRGPAFRLVERAAAHIFPDARPIPYVMTAASDSRFFSRVCSQCIRFAPIRITREQLDTIHGTDERVDLSALAPAVDFYQWIFREV